MVIQSKFKDYYDYVAQQYGGGDPKIRYVRKRIKEGYDERTGGWLLAVQMDSSPVQDPDSMTNYYNASNNLLEFAFLAVAGKPYLLSREHKDYGWRDLDGYAITDVATVRDGSRYLRRRDWSFLGEEDSRLIELSRKVGAPVFVIDRLSRNWRRDGYTIGVDPLCPILKDLGMASLVPAEQMYQELAYFMGNTMHPSPDVKPPVEVSNRDKILAAGFDLKQSFRHRV